MTNPMDLNAPNALPASATLDGILAALQALLQTDIRVATARAYAIGVRDGRDGMANEQLTERVQILLQ